MTESETPTPAPTTQRRVFRCVDLFDEIKAWGDAAHKAMKSDAPRGPQITFAPTLSAIIGGHITPGVHVLHGAPNAGKTALASMIAATCGTPALIVSTEMSPRELFLRQIARTQNLPLKKLLSGQLTGAEILFHAKAAAADSPWLCILDATSSQVSGAEIHREARDLRNDAGHMLLVIDSLHSWARRNVEATNEYDRTTAATAGFEQLAAAEKVAVLVIAERSRSTMQTGGMHAAKGTASVEYSARSVWSLNVCGDGELDASGSIALTLDIEKNKDGESHGSVPLAFAPAFMRFRER